jgi:hypothetical protein
MSRQVVGIASHLSVGGTQSKYAQVWKLSLCTSIIYGSYRYAQVSYMEALAMHKYHIWKLSLCTGIIYGSSRYAQVSCMEALAMHRYEVLAMHRYEVLAMHRCGSSRALTQVLYTKLANLSDMVQAW